MDNIISLLSEKIDTNDILVNEPMFKHTSFKVGGKVDYFVKARNIEQIKYVIDLSKKMNLPLFILGNGSNLLVKDGGIRGIVLKPELKDIFIEMTNEEEKVIVTVGSGVKLIELAVRLMNEEIAGFEFASGIPGTIGGFVKMNAGAYGKEAKDIIVSTKIMDYDGKIRLLSNDEHKFEYRESVFSLIDSVILETKMTLHKGNKNEIRSLMEEYRKSRFDKQPLNYPSAGSTFKRGKDFITAKLIDECGLKGYCIGDAEVSTKHAGFIVNKGNATAKDILCLMEYVKDTVLQKIGKEIEPEIEIIGED